MAKKRKSWEPEYRFGGNPASYMVPNVLGENQSPWGRQYKPKKRKR